MKKMTMAIAAMVLATSAMAADVTVSGVRNLAGRDSTAASVAVSQKFGDYSLALGADRTLNKGVDVNRFSLIGSRDVFSAGAFSANVQVGAARVVTLGQSSGYAFVSGVGAQYALTPSIALVADFRNQQGQARIKSQNGNSVDFGVKYSF